MSARYFCDQCKKELRDDEYGRVKRKMGDITVEVITAWKGAWNGGNVCHACTRKAVAKGKDWQ